jgi:hypothetical protein
MNRTGVVAVVMACVLQGAGLAQDKPKTSVRPAEKLLLDYAKSQLDAIIQSRDSARLTSDQVASVAADLKKLIALMEATQAATAEQQARSLEEFARLRELIRGLEHKAAPPAASRPAAPILGTGKFSTELLVPKVAGYRGKTAKGTGQLLASVGGSRVAVAGRRVDVYSSTLPDGPRMKLGSYSTDVEGRFHFDLLIPKDKKVAKGVYLIVEFAEDATFNATSHGPSRVGISA